jgi:hypothetical protein
LFTLTVPNSNRSAPSTTVSGHHIMADDQLRPAWAGRHAADPRAAPPALKPGAGTPDAGRSSGPAAPRCSRWENPDRSTDA